MRLDSARCSRLPSRSLPAALPSLAATLALALGLTACRQAPPPAPPPPCQPSTPVPVGAAVVPAAIPLPGSPVAGPTDLVLSEPAKQALLRFARLTCNGQLDEARKVELPPELGTLDAPVIAMVFDADGTRRGQRRLDDPGVPVAEKLARMVPELCGRDPQGFLHVLVVSFASRLPNFGDKGLFENRVFEPQVTGLAFELEGKRAELDPVEALTLNLGLNSSRSHVARQLGFEANRLENHNGLKLEVYRVIHFAETWPDRSFANFHRGHVMLTAEQVTPALLQERIALIGEWYRHNVHDGQVTYEYSVQRDRVNDERRTMVRSTMATWVLNRLAQHLDDAELARLGEQTIAYYLEHYFQMERSLAAGKILPSEEKLPSGDRVKNRYTAGSFIAAAIMERPDRARWPREPGLLMDWAMSYARPDGVMWTQISMNQYFDPGQLLLSVAINYDKTRDEKYRAFFEKVWNAYERPLYDMMHLGNGRYIPYAPAWFTQPAARMYLVTADARYRDMVYAINDRVAMLYEYNARDQVYYDYDGQLAPKPLGYGNTSVTAAALESLVDGAIVARKDGDTARFRSYSQIIRHTVAFLLRMQYVPANTYYIRNKQRAIGGFKRDLLDTVLWMDSVWHLTSAFLKIQQERLLEPPPAPAVPATGAEPAAGSAAPPAGPQPAAGSAVP